MAPPTTIEDDQLAFQEALDYLAQKTGLDTDSWVEGQGIVQLSNFTVAAAKGALLQDIHDVLSRSIDAGESMQDFLDRFSKVAARWAGKSAWRGQLIYEQNVRSAHGLGRLQQMNEVADSRPYWQWRHSGGSVDPRPEHRAMDGKVFHHSDVKAYPPLGFNCRCQMFSMSQRDFERNGGKLSVFDLEPEKGFLKKEDIEAKINELKIDSTLKDFMRDSVL